MSQARVTDFFAQRKKVTSEPAKQRQRSSFVSSSTVSLKAPSENKDAVSCSSPVHKEFLRVIDEASGVNNNNGGEANPGKELFSSPRTPKRSSAEAEITEHSSSKKRRQAVEVRKASTNGEKTTKKSARKKLLLQEDSPQVKRQNCSQDCFIL